MFVNLKNSQKIGTNTIKLFHPFIMIDNPLSISNNRFKYFHIFNYKRKRVLPTLKYWNFIHSIIKFKHKLKFVKYYTTIIISLNLVIQLIKRKIYIINPLKAINNKLFSSFDITILLFPNKIILRFDRTIFSK